MSNSSLYASPPTATTIPLVEAVMQTVVKRSPNPTCAVIKQKPTPVPLHVRAVMIIGNNKTVYLKASVEELTSRLFLEKVHRPVISHLDTKEQLEEFIRKHLFERAFYYNQSNIIVDVDGATPTAIVEKIKSKLD